MQSIKKTFLRNMMLIPLISIGLLFCVWMNSEYSAFLEDAAATRRNFEESQKEMLREEVSAVVDFINYTKAQTETVLEKTVKERVYEAHSVASHLYQSYKDSKTSEELQKLIKEALRQLRFNDGRGYYFIFNLDGIEQLFADRPELEGMDMLPLQGAAGEFVVRDMIELVRQQEEGFYRYSWTKPGETANIFRKTAFVKLFSPYAWVIGTGEYVEDVRDDLQEQVLQRIVGQRFGKEGYFFGSIFGGMPLFTNGRITKGGPSIWESTDPHGVKLSQEYEKAVQNPDGGYVRYSWQKLDNPQPSPKISFVTAIPDWRWIIGAGVYLDSVEKEIEDKKELLFQRFLNKTLISAAMLSLLLLAIFLWVKHLAVTIQEGMDTFTQFCRKAARESILIDPATLKYQEFNEIALSTNLMLEGQRRANLEVVESEEKYRTLFASMVHGVFYQSFDGTLSDVNQAALDIFGLGREEFLGRSSQHPEWRIIREDGSPLPAMEHPSMTALHSGRPVLNCLVGVFNPERQNFVWVVVNAVPQFKEGASQPFQVVVTLSDVTAQKTAEAERVRLEAQLQQAQRLEAIGTLAGGIAHDFNNILGAILGYAEMARDDSPADSSVAKDLGEILRAGNRAKDLVRQILAFSRQAGTERIYLLPATIIKEAVKLLRPSLPSTIEIVQHIHPAAGPILADPTQLHQILVNLCTNAFHAMEEGGGILTIALKNVTLTKEDLRREPHLQPGQFVHLTVGDTGAGIKTDVLERVFEPYFTTKEVGKGTGMGLAIVHGIVKSYAGFVTCSSQPGKGTMVEVFLPLVDEGSVEVAEPEEPLVGGKESILFVDDEPHLAEMGKNMLERLGYRVTIESNSLDAMAAFLHDPNRFDLVVTDQTMPGLTGLDMARRMLMLRPGLPIILCTGYSTLVSEEKARATGIRGFAMKPLAKRDIALLIRRVLSSAV